MMIGRSTRLWRAILITIVIRAGSAPGAQQAAQEPAPVPKPKPVSNFVIRGCLAGAKLKQIEPHDPPIKLPDEVRITTTRAIRDQVKALNGHQVELTGALHGVPGVETGVLIGDSDHAKVYVGGGDPNLGNDLVMQEPPTLHAKTIKDVAPSCATAKSR
jgi:hypothetical protein